MGYWLVVYLVLGGGAATAQLALKFSPADPVQLPVEIDSNSPILRDGDTLRLFHSTGEPLASTFDNNLHYIATQPVALDNRDHLPMWIESLWDPGTGAFYAWYHHERTGVCPGSPMTAPEIGALISYDGGHFFHDLGIVLSSGDAVDCSAANGYFAGGLGDFTVIADQQGEFLYFLYGAYGGSVARQGVAIARMAMQDANSPVGKVWKYDRGKWNQPGLRGTATPIFPARVGWQSPETDSFWGPSVHWNHYLGQYVMLLNRSCCEPGWPQEGVYLTTAADLADPASWQEPLKILEGGDWYPWVLGAGPAETSALAGQRMRLFTRDTSEWELVFE